MMVLWTHRSPPVPGALPASSLFMLVCKSLLSGISSQGQSPTGTRCHWHFLLNKCMELWEEWALKSHPEGGVGKRGAGEERAAFFSSCKRNLRRDELVPQRKGKEIVDFCPEHTRGTVGKIWHAKTWNFYVSLKKKLWVKFWLEDFPPPFQPGELEDFLFATKYVLIWKSWVFNNFMGRVSI